MHQPEHNIGDHEDPAAGQTWLVSFVGTALLIVIFLGLTALYYNYAANEEATKVIARQPMGFEQITAAQQAQLEGEPRWIERPSEDPENPVMEPHLVIPIEQAMELVVKEHGQR
jgi:hypothetical protein